MTPAPTAPTTPATTGATTVGTDVDWSVLDIDGMVDVAQGAARKIHRQFGRQLAGTTEYDDLYHDALIMLATKHHEVRQCMADPQLGLGVVHHRLTRDLFDTVKTDAKRRRVTRSYDELTARHTATTIARTAA